jgi:hypothetical protein
MTAMRLLVLVFVIALALTALTVSAAAVLNPVRATMSTSSTTPLVDTPWRYTITVKDQAGKPVVAKVRLQILLGTLVVGCWKSSAIVPCSGAKAGRWIAFKGKRTGTITWPAQSAGVKLTFQATVVAGTRTLRLRAPVMVRLV